MDRPQPQAAQGEQGRPGRPDTLRTMNDSACLSLLIARGPMTRLQLSSATGLSGPTITQVVTRLSDAGLIEQAGLSTGQHGPNAVLYQARTRDHRGVALHVMAGKILARMVDASNAEFPTVDVRTASATKTPRPAHEILRAAVEAACVAAGEDPHSTVSICVGVPSAFSQARDSLSFVSSMKGWPRKDVRAHLEDALGWTVLIENDANLAAVAEARCGGGHEDFALLWAGEGLGVATITAGRLARGAAGGAGEIGYLPVTTTGAALDPAATDMQDLLGMPAITRLVRRHRPSIRSGREALAALRDSPIRAALLADLAPRVAEVIGPVIAVLDPARIVLGGPTGAAGGEELAALVFSHLRKTTRWTTPVVATSVHDQPVLLGAALIEGEHLSERILARVD